MALVIGAGQGIGQAIALALAERGAVVIATDLTPPHETVRKIGPTAYTLSRPRGVGLKLALAGNAKQRDRSASAIRPGVTSKAPRLHFFLSGTGLTI